jgi:hypothetical protein
MRSYWFKIIIGALAIFFVGYTGVWFARTRIARVKNVIHSTDPITIPLAFLPFTLDGQRLGTFRRVTIRRDTPERVSGVDVRVTLADSAGPLPEGCRLTPTDPGKFSPESGFRCAGAADSSLVDFGTVRVVRSGSEDVTVPLVLDSALVSEFRKEGTGVGMTTDAFAGQEGAAAAARAEQVRVRVQAKIDSARLRTSVEVAPPAPPNPPKPN